MDAVEGSRRLTAAAAGRTGVTSLHQRILSDIEARIVSGEWRPGHRIPFEHELTTQYGCSRMTVNKVMTQLAKAGLIERRRRAGSFVTRPHSQSAVLAIQTPKAEVQALGLPYRHEIVRRSRRRSTPADRQSLGLAAPGPVLALVCRHFAGPRPFCYEERIINLAAVPEANAVDFAVVAPGTWLIERVPWSAAENRIKAIGADAAEAEALQVAVGTPCLVVERQTWRLETPVTKVRLIYPGSDYELLARFAPQG